MSEQHWDESYDFVVVGSGGGSMCAALVAQEHGKSSLIIEKLDKVGGSTGYSGGVWWIPNNPLMAREGVVDSYERARQYLDAVVGYDGPGTSSLRREAFLRSGPEMVAYLERKGMRFKRPEGYSDYYCDLPGGEPRSRSLIAELFDIKQLGSWKDRLSIYKGPPMRVGLDELPDLILLKRTWRGFRAALRVGLRIIAMTIRGQDLRGAGAALQGRMLQMALRDKVTIWPGTPVEELIVADGRVAGVVARRAGKMLRIQARDGVLLNVGGFSRNAAMRQQYGPQPSSAEWTAANPGDTGELILAAMRLGAATDCLDQAWWTPTSRGPNDTPPPGAVAEDGTALAFGHHFDISLPHAILVDGRGQRFANEAGSYMEVGQRMYQRHAETGKGVPCWAIVESRHRARYLWGPHLGRTPRSWIDSGYMIKAASIEQLALRCGIEPTDLQRTISRFNDFCRSGIDQEFGRGGKAFDRYHGDPTVRPNPNLGPIEKPPFYAVRIYPGDVGTAGGLVTDHDGQVLRADGSVIAGLYATGNSTASVMGKTYPGAGASIGASFVFAYRAALHVVGKAQRP